MKYMESTMNLLNDTCKCSWVLGYKINQVNQLDHNRNFVEEKYIGCGLKQKYYKDNTE